MNHPDKFGIYGRDIDPTYTEFHNGRNLSYAPFPEGVNSQNELSYLCAEIDVMIYEYGEDVYDVTNHTVTRSANHAPVIDSETGIATQRFVEVTEYLQNSEYKKIVAMGFLHFIDDEFMYGSTSVITVDENDFYEIELENWYGNNQPHDWLIGAAVDGEIMTEFEYSALYEELNKLNHYMKL